MSIRDVVLRCMPSNTRARAEADSRRWIFTCTACGRDSSIWDIGGLRFKAKGEPKSLVTCPACGHRGRHTTRYRADEA